MGRHANSPKETCGSQIVKDRVVMEPYHSAKKRQQ
ncbi:hypothetical protein A2U01_0114528, partial [Trifolium medium]|nr:hypothetical protein [Trifolium medium]